MITFAKAHNLDKATVQKRVVDTTVNLSCGCVAHYPEGQLDNGRMFLCKKHINEDAFIGLRIVEELAQQIRRGCTQFVVEGR